MTENARGDPEQTVVSEYPIYLSGVHNTETVGTVSYTFKQFLPHHGWRDITIGAGLVFSGAGVGNLADSGAVVREPKLFIRYIHDALDAWHRTNRMEQRYEQCGWKDQETKFLVGLTLYDSTGSRNVIGNEELTTRAQWLTPSPAGDVRKWTATVNQLFGGHMPSLFALLCSFAAPLMRFHTKHEGGAIISLLNRMSGTGKTTTLEGAMSVWGDPQGLSMTSADTAASKGLAFAALGNLPVMYDELASIMSRREPEALKNLVDIFSSGHDRRRALQHGEGIRHTQGTWQTLLITASNLSIVDQLEVFSKGTDAPGFRVIEVTCDYPDRFDYAAGDRLKTLMFENAGHAGAVYMQHLLKPDILDFTRKALQQWTDEIWRATGFKSPHRFWVRTLGAVAVAGEIVRSLGLLQVDPQEVIAWVLNELGHRTAPITGQENAQAKATDATAILGEFLSNHLRDTLVVQASWRAGDRAVEPVTRPTGKLQVRYELSSGRLCAPAKDFRNWIIGQGYTYTDVIRELTDAGVLVNQKRMVTLGAGTTLASAPVACVEFDMGHPSVSQIARIVKEPEHARGT